MGYFNDQTASAVVYFSKRFCYSFLSLQTEVLRDISMAKVEQPKMVAKAKPKEEKTGGPSNEKTSCDAIVVKPITELESKIIQQVEVQYLLHHDKLLNFRY